MRADTVWTALPGATGPTLGGARPSGVLPAGTVGWRRWIYRRDSIYMLAWVGDTTTSILRVETYAISGDSAHLVREVDSAGHEVPHLRPTPYVPVRMLMIPRDGARSAQLFDIRANLWPAACADTARLAPRM
ncbi:MAG TPA: hypothetical protein VMH39_11635, partial [Gemmatimonadaceae bacterium]|nr:hypothetical protein [Gemmatimonadaceae bacterium]